MNYVECELEQLTVEAADDLRVHTTLTEGLMGNIYEDLPVDTAEDNAFHEALVDALTARDNELKTAARVIHNAIHKLAELEQQVGQFRPYVADAAYDALETLSRLLHI